ncbi:hypothetical protein GCM10007857_84020 [Bradyrhizobium iriomotense]|uniref:Uncharacterized protein n=1 Tax=Bradyrhizobium iriomotense TaxID=441950 RepID=A0ABQ6BE31_9BRAD|nr:hypothetical protein GCM10007857_84020 [Bradyrhizobium iriomotense]
MALWLKGSFCGNAIPFPFKKRTSLTVAAQAGRGFGALWKKTQCAFRKDGRAAPT